MPIKFLNGESKSVDEIHDRLKAVRQHLGLNQVAMAELLNTSVRSYKGYEAGHREVPLPMAITIIVHAKLDAEWFLFGDNGRPSVDGTE